MYPNNIAVMALSKRVDFAQVDAVPACLPGPEMDFGGSTLTVGKGPKGPRSFSKVLVKTQAEIESNQEMSQCSLYGSALQPEHQFCTTVVSGYLCRDLGGLSFVSVTANLLNSASQILKSQSSQARKIVDNNDRFQERYLK